MTRTYSLDDKLSAADITHANNEGSFVELLKEARLPVNKVDFTRRKARFHAGDELVAHLDCPNGHRLEMTLRDLRENLKNRFFNDPDVVPHLCEECAYPSTQVVAKKSTVYHRLSALSRLYPSVKYISGFDAAGKSWETYQCGKQHDDGTPHSQFQLRFDKLVNNAKEGKLRHTCYECGLLAGEVPETKSKTVDMMTGRMKLINAAISTISQISNPRVPVVRVIEGNAHPVEESGAISTTKTLLQFTCGNSEHSPAERSADSYFNVAKGGYCKACLKAAGVKTVSELPISK